MALDANAKMAYITAMKVKAINRLRAILTRNDLRQKDMAKALGQPEDVISLWVTGKRAPNTANALAIWKFLRKHEPTLQIEDLFKGGAR